MLTRKNLQQNISGLFADTAALQQRVSETGACPDAVSAWLGKLKLLYGVPINYLVPDEGMLPPESIRFFYVDPNWIEALIDGAFSIGRNLNAAMPTASMTMDKAMNPLASIHTDKASASLRAKALGLEAQAISFATISGFILRSSVVQSCPGIGVNPYPQGGTPDNPDPAKVVLLNILRMERLGNDSDTLICLVEGDIYRVDIHEPPEALHYGLDKYSLDGRSIVSQKTIYRFTKSGDRRNPSVNMDMQNPVHMDIAAGNCFRNNNDQRTVKMKTLADLIASNQQPPLPSIDSSEMGFEMIEGVGMVSFYKEDCKQ